MHPGNPRGGCSRPSRRLGVADRGPYVDLYSSYVDFLSSIVEYISSVQIKVSGGEFPGRSASRAVPGNEFRVSWQAGASPDFAAAKNW